MCKIMEEVREEAREEGREEGRELGRGEEKAQTASRMLQSGRYGLEEVAEMSDLPLEEVRRLMQKSSRG